MFSLFILLLLPLHSTYAAESEVVLPKAQFNGAASFESLNDDTYVPSQKINFTADRSDTLDSLKWNNPYPSLTYGYPGGAIGVNLGGRSIGDTQVTTLGVPLNLPQGGGADLSTFPAFLWKEAILSPTISNSGFSPTAVSGRIEFIPWTRSTLLQNKTVTNHSRIAGTYDRDVQTFSLGASNQDYAATAGTVLGKQQGSAGGLSTYLMQKPGSQVLFHVIGSQIKSDSLGSKSFPTPLAKTDVWRVIPVIESHQELEGNWLVESTLYGDFQELKYSNPSAAAFDSDTHTFQYGVENAILQGPYTLALSARYVRFNGAGFPEINEVPLFGALTRDLYLTDSVSLKASLNTNYVKSLGLYPGGKLSAKFSADEHNYPFAEVGEVAKMPTLIDRYAPYPGTVPNPGLKPERAHLALVGYQYEKAAVKSTSTLKGELRNHIQVNETLPSFDIHPINSGNARLYSFNEEIEVKILEWLKVRSQSLLTYSRLADTQYEYPNLPAFSEAAGVLISPRDQMSLELKAKYTGPSNAPTFGSGEAFHPSYTLFGATVAYHFTQDLGASAGVDNIFDNRAEAVLGYPLEGRLVNLAFHANF